MHAREEFWNRLVEQVRQQAGVLPALPEREEQIARLALAGYDVHAVAQLLGTSEEAIWSFMQHLANELAGRPAGGASRGYEIGGLGSDTDPGVTGGYGDIGNEPPIPVPEEEIEPPSGTGRPSE